MKIILISLVVFTIMVVYSLMSVCSKASREEEERWGK